MLFLIHETFTKQIFFLTMHRSRSCFQARSLDCSVSLLPSADHWIVWHVQRIHVFHCVLNTVKTKTHWKKAFLHSTTTNSTRPASKCLHNDHIGVGFIFCPSHGVRPGAVRYRKRLDRIKIEFANQSFSEHLPARYFGSPFSNLCRCPPHPPFLSRSVCALSALLNSIMIETMSPTSELHYHQRNRLTVLITMS